MNGFLKREWPLLLILFLNLLAAVSLYPHMPDRVPIHWNAAGVADGYGGRAFGAFFLPVINLALYLLFLVLPKLDPKKANYEKFAGAYLMIRYLFHLFMVGLFALTSMAGLGYPVDFGLWIASGTAVLFVILGYAMGKVRHNYFVGFRLPWTLASEEVWEKTHRFGSKAMVFGGLCALIGVLLTQNTVRFAILMAGVFLPVIITAVYSCLSYRKTEKPQ